MRFRATASLRNINVSADKKRLDITQNAISLIEQISEDTERPKKKSKAAAVMADAGTEVAAAAEE